MFWWRHEGPMIKAQVTKTQNIPTFVISNKCGDKFSASCAFEALAFKNHTLGESRVVVMQNDERMTVYLGNQSDWIYINL